MCRVHNLSPLLFNRQCCGHVVSVPQALLDFFFFLPPQLRALCVTNECSFYTVCLKCESHSTAHQMKHLIAQTPNHLMWTCFSSEISRAVSIHMLLL